jgi:hypothetical protein
MRNAGISYNTSDCFYTFPFPGDLDSILEPAKSFRAHRRAIMDSRTEGLTKTYNRFHDPGEKSEDIARLRASHIEMDRAVVAAYGWSDLELGHGFHQTKQGVRYTLSEPARRTVLDRLLALNHKRYAEGEAERAKLAISAPRRPQSQEKRQRRQTDLRLAVIWRG